MSAVEETRRWLRYAQEDSRAAEAMLGRDDTYPRHACWLAQQAAEKALKGALIFEQIDFPFSHDLDRLRDLLPEGWRVKIECPDLAELTEWAVEARYPGDMPEAVDADALNAAQQARAVIKSIVADLKARNVIEG
jgi:HEPN domain-containing protein